MSVPFLVRLSIAVFAVSVSSTALLAEQHPQTTASPQPPATQEPPAPRVEEVGTEPLACPFCDYSHKDLSGKNFTNANLQGANFSGANLSNAVFNGAELSGANFTGANLTNASFDTTSIGVVDLSVANLTNANLQGARMNGTDLQFADLSGTNLGGVDLSRASIGPVLRVGTTGSGRTNLRGARLRRDVQLDTAHADTTDLVRVDPPAPRANAAAAVHDWACGEADLSQLTSVVYVKPTGSDGKDCGKSSTSPCATIAAGINSCTPPGCGVLVYYERYRLTDTIRMRSGVSVYGGCLPGSSSPEYRSDVFAPEGGKPVLHADISLPAIIQNLALRGSAASGKTAAPSITVTLRDSISLSFVNCVLYGNRGANGADGGPSAPAAKGGDGASGDYGGAGGTSTCGGGAGGMGGGPMRVEKPCHADCAPGSCFGGPGTSVNTFYPPAPYPPEPSPPMAGGYPGQGSCGACEKPQVARGKDGKGRGIGWCGASFRRVNAAYVSRGDIDGNGGWVASSNNNGQPAMPGDGGGGGGAGGSCAKGPRFGNRGGGGGAGGCGGAGGKSGQQGGASFTILASTSNSLAPAPPAWFKGCRIIGGRGGDGGEGGEGGLGGQGGAGGSGGTVIYTGGEGGKGGMGWDGGLGGGGGGGDGGPSVLFVTHHWPASSVNNSTWQVNTSTQLGSSGSPGDGGFGGNAPPYSCLAGDTGSPGYLGLVAVSTSF